MHVDVAHVVGPRHLLQSYDRLSHGGASFAALKSRARQRRFGFVTLLTHNDRIAGPQLAFDDFDEAVVVQSGHNRGRNRLAITQHPDTGLP